MGLQLERQSELQQQLYTEFDRQYFASQNQATKVISNEDTEVAVAQADRRQLRARTDLAFVGLRTRVTEAGHAGIRPDDCPSDPTDDGEYEPAAPQAAPTQPMVDDGIAIPTIADVGAAAPRAAGGRRKAGG